MRYPITTILCVAIVAVTALSAAVHYSNSRFLEKLDTVEAMSARNAEDCLRNERDLLYKQLVTAVGEIDRLEKKVEDLEQAVEEYRKVPTPAKSKATTALVQLYKLPEQSRSKSMGVIRQTTSSRSAQLRNLP